MVTFNCRVTDTNFHKKCTLYVRIIQLRRKTLGIMLQKIFAKTIYRSFCSIFCALFNGNKYTNGNLRLTRQAREILALVPNDLVTVTVDCEASDELRIPQEFLDEAGISEESTLEVYVDGGRVVVQEAAYD